MDPSVSHRREEETPEAKARWFQSLSVTERLDLFCSMTDLALRVNPRLGDQKCAEPAEGRIQVISGS
jgi:hypothetical protein